MSNEEVALENSLQFFRQLKTELPNDLAIPLLGTYPPPQNENISIKTCALNVLFSNKNKKCTNEP